MLPLPSDTLRSDSQPRAGNGSLPQLLIPPTLLIYTVPPAPCKMHRLKCKAVPEHGQESTQVGWGGTFTFWPQEAVVDREVGPRLGVATVLHACLIPSDT